MLKENLSASTVEIIGYQGARVEAYLAVPGTAVFPGLVLIHHMPGYDAGSKELVRRFAAAGIATLCPNLYFREAPGESPSRAYEVVRALGGIDDAQIIGDVAGSVTHLRELPGASGAMGVIGYCSGGRQALLAACKLPELDAVVDCYGAFVMTPPPAPLNLKAAPIAESLPGLSCPLLGIFGAEDTNPSPAEVNLLAHQLSFLDKEFDFETYEHAGHAFMAVDRASYRAEATTQATARIMNFLIQHLKMEPAQ